MPDTDDGYGCGNCHDGVDRYDGDYGHDGNDGNDGDDSNDGDDGNQWYDRRCTYWCVLRVLPFSGHIAFRQYVQQHHGTRVRTRYWELSRRWHRFYYILLREWYVRRLECDV